MTKQRAKQEGWIDFQIEQLATEISRPIPSRREVRTLLFIRWFCYTTLAQIVLVSILDAVGTR